MDIYILYTTAVLNERSGFPSADFFIPSIHTAATLHINVDEKTWSILGSTSHRPYFWNVLYYVYVHYIQ